MEVAPQFWQSPETLKELWVSTAGGTVSGTQASQAVAGTVSSRATAASTTAATLASDTARNQAVNGLANSGRGAVSTGAAVSTAGEAMVPLAAFSQLRAGHDPAGGQSPGDLRRHDDLVQPRAECFPQRCHRSGSRAP